MKHLIAALFVLLNATAQAQDNMMIDQQGLMNMMQNVKQLQDCFKDVSQQQLQQLENSANQFRSEVKALCQAGKRNTAQQQAIQFSQQMLANPVVKTFKHCGAMIQQMMPSISTLEDQFDPTKQHVCDTNLDIH